MTRVVGYGVAKAAVDNATRWLAVELARSFGGRLRVNAIAPGYIDTDMVAAVPADVLEKIVAKIPVGRLGQAQEIARGVAFLCSEEAGFVTGSTRSHNGGRYHRGGLKRLQGLGVGGGRFFRAGDEQNEAGGSDQLAQVPMTRKTRGHAQVQGLQIRYRPYHARGALAFRQPESKKPPSY